MAEPLRTRLVRAVVETLRETDPVVTVGIGDGELRVHWPADRPPYCTRCGLPHHGDCSRDKDK